MARSKKEKKTLIERIKPAGFKDLIRKLILLVCVCVFCYSAYNLKRWMIVMLRLKKLM